MGRWERGEDGEPIRKTNSAECMKDKHNYLEVIHYHVNNIKFLTKSENTHFSLKMGMSL